MLICQGVFFSNKKRDPKRKLQARDAFLVTGFVAKKVLVPKDFTLLFKKKSLDRGRKMESSWKMGFNLYHAIAMFIHFPLHCDTLEKQ